MQASAEIIDLSPKIGWWTASRDSELYSGNDALWRGVAHLGRPFCLVETDSGELAASFNGALSFDANAPGALRVMAISPAIQVEDLGSREFMAAYGLRYPYVAGAMANGIASTELVSALGKAGMLAFFGAAGLSPERVEAAIVTLGDTLGAAPYGFNLIHSPGDPALEEQIVDLYLRRGVHNIEAAAYLDLTLPVVRYRISGLARGSDGKIDIKNRIIAKISRVEVASKFLTPPPENMIRALLERGDITAQQAELASEIPMADDITVEADSGGHTDNRPALALMPTMMALAERLNAKYNYATVARIGLAGGISTPASAAAAFAMGAAYIVTGTVNQACVESGSSDTVRAMLSEAEQADVIMAPAADMFEMGVKVQVLKRGTMFAMRAQKLYDIYRGAASLDAIAPKDRAMMEKQIFRAPFEQIWEQIQTYFESRDPRQVERAMRDPKHKLALMCRWYLGKASRWANAGDLARKVDYQIWCGPAMGAFNEWARGHALEQTENRKVVEIAKNILFGAAVSLRLATLRGQGIDTTRLARHQGPWTSAELEVYL